MAGRLTTVQVSQSDSLGVTFSPRFCLLLSGNTQHGMKQEQFHPLPTPTALLFLLFFFFFETE